MEIFAVFLQSPLVLFSLGEKGKPGCCCRGSVNHFCWWCVMWWFDVIQCDGIGGGEDATVVIQFLLPGITYNVPHTAMGLAGNSNKSACAGAD